jgi:hypothetical protein
VEAEPPAGDDVTPEEARADVAAQADEEKAAPASDLLTGTPDFGAIARFRWPSGAWFCFRVNATGKEWTDWPDGAPWPKDAVDRYVDGGGCLVPAQLVKVRERACMLHVVPMTECGCPAMYTVLAEERLKRSEAKLKEIAAQAETAKPDPTTCSTSPPGSALPAGSHAESAAGSGASASPGSSPTPEPGLWSSRCLDCGASDVLPAQAGGLPDACQKCGSVGVFLWRPDQPAPPHESYANLIVWDGALGDVEELAGGACYVCGGPLASPGGKVARVRGGFPKAHLACVQEKRAKTSAGVSVFVRVGDPKGYCHACKAPFRAQELTILRGQAHAHFSACQAGPTPPAAPPAGRMLGRAMKETCVVCEKEMVKGQVVAGHLDGTAHMLCITIPAKPPGLEESPL